MTAKFRKQPTSCRLAPILAALVLGHYLVLSSVDCSLSAFSETRSFRDALDGHSMDDAINGPVDQDTSSYGERASPGGTLLTVPANGNLNPNSQQPQQNQPQQPQQQQQVDVEQQTQQKSSPMNPVAPSAGPELEREAGPIDGFQLGDTPQLMEQRNSQQAPRAARLRGAQRSASQKQQQQKQPEINDFGSKEASFGEEPTQRNQNRGGKSADAGWFGSRNGAGQAAQKPYEQPQQQQQYEQQQQQSEPNSFGGEQSYQQQQPQLQQRPYSADTMNNGNEVQMPATGVMMQMADRMQAAPKPDMLARQQVGQSYQLENQRQSAPPMMMLTNLQQMSSGYGQQQQQQQQPSPSGQNYSPMGGLIGPSSASSPRGGLRRARQRKSDKMSPAMVNAILNKMLDKKNEQQQVGSNSYASGNVQAGNSQQQYNNNNNNNINREAGLGRPSKMAMLMMKSPINAETLASMLLPQMPGSESMSPAKRQEYQQMMVSAIMQQMSHLEQPQTGGQMQQMQQVQQQEPAYGSRPRVSGQTMMAPPAAVVMMLPASPKSYGQQNNQPAGSGPQTGYGQQPQSRPRKSSVSMTMNGQQIMGGDYGQQEQQQQPSQQPQRSMYSGGDSYAINGLGGQREPARSKPAQQYGSGAKIPSANQARQQMNMNTAYAGASQPEQQQVQQQQQQPEQQQQQQSQLESDDGYNKNQNQQGSNNSSSYPSDQGQSQEKEQVEQQHQQQDDQNGAAPAGQAEPFAFDYKVADNYGNGHYRKEESDRDGVVRGSYGYSDVNGIYRHVEYVADENGFRAKIKSNEPGLSNEPSGATKGQAGPEQTQMAGPTVDGYNQQPSGQQPQQEPSQQVEQQVQQQQQQTYQSPQQQQPQQQQMQQMQQQQPAQQPQQQQQSDSGEK